MDYTWDAAKAGSNARKHGVGFEEAASVFADSLAYTFADPEHSVDEERLLTFGRSAGQRLLVVSHTEREQGTVIRIISAREATSHERTIYEEG